MKTIFVLLAMCLSSLFYPAGISATDNENEVVEMPSVDPEGRVPTLNKMGWNLLTMDVYSKAFIDYAAKLKTPVLEIGAGYGFTAIEALKVGVRLTVNDLDERHLKILERNTPEEYRKQLQLKPGRFPDQTQFSKNEFDAILIARVLVCLTKKQLIETLEKAHEILKPGGKLFIVADSPFLKNWQHFLPEYEQRKKQGDPFPGFIDNPLAYNVKGSAYRPSTIHFLDYEVLSRELERAGFKIEKIEYLARRDYPSGMQADGRENVAVIAVK